ncbi:MAG: ogr/Delta-like zinc finger family protein [Candidatus Accumulibacter sp.]|jgi:predicted RNA-binding Zn-ribbon protein involved in translation (DUF1610 family)|nr:ogr/Delta-like zinc finger family protein [Accumulibacter sp.]
MRIICPHCGQISVVRTSREITPLSREAFVQCPNINCGHIWKIIVSAATTIHESLNPRAGVFIPLSRKIGGSPEKEAPMSE